MSDYLPTRLAAIAAHARRGALASNLPALTPANAPVIVSRHDLPREAHGVRHSLPPPQRSPHRANATTRVRARFNPQTPSP